LVVDGPIFRVENPRRLKSSVLDRPVDIAPAAPEIASRAFASNTSLAGGSDLYVVNRGTGTVARIKQDGTVVAVRRGTLPGAGARRWPASAGWGRIVSTGSAFHRTPIASGSPSTRACRAIQRAR